MNKLYIALSLCVAFALQVECHLSLFKPLQVQCLVNGCEVPAIVDTGAEITVMSLNCAEKCKLVNKIDTRYSGTAMGVGVSEIIGRIDDVKLKLGNSVISNKISVLSQSKCDFIIGLDILRRYDCNISIGKNRLQLQMEGKKVTIPLLPAEAMSFDPEEIASPHKPMPEVLTSVNTIKQGVLKPRRVNDEETEDEDNEEWMESGAPISMAGV